MDETCRTHTENENFIHFVQKPWKEENFLWYILDVRWILNVHLRNKAWGCVLHRKGVKDDFASVLNWAPPLDGESDQYDYEGLWRCRHTVREGLRLSTMGKTCGQSDGCTCTYVYHCQNSVELNTFYGSSSNNPVHLKHFIDQHLCHGQRRHGSSCWSELVATVGTVP